MMNGRPTKKPDAPRGPFRELRAAVSRTVGSKGFLFAISLLAAIAAWSALVASDGTLIRHKVLSGVAVNVTGETSLKSRGYIVMDDIRELVPEVRMTVEVTQQNYSRVTGTSYNPHFDLSKIEGQGEAELEINFSSQLYGTVISCEPSSVTVNVERYMTRRVPVVLELTGEIADNVYLDSYKLDPTMLSVSGPQSLVLSVSRAVAKMDLSALSMDRASDRTALTVELQDAYGKPVSSDKLEVTNQTVITDSVVVDTELLPSKVVPLMIDEFVIGEPAEGYELVDIHAGEVELLVAAKQETLDAIEFLSTDLPLDISGATGSMSDYVRLRRPSGVENTLPTDVAVTAEIQEKTIERTLRSVPIDIDGLGGGLSASLAAKQATVQLTGLYGFITSLDKQDVRLFVDASGLEAGEHVLPVQIGVDNAGEFSCALSTPEVAVTIKAQ